MPEIRAALAEADGGVLVLLRRRWRERDSNMGFEFANDASGKRIAACFADLNVHLLVGDQGFECTPSEFEEVLACQPS